LAFGLAKVLDALGGPRGLIVSLETGFYGVDTDYRVPDIAVYRSDQASKRGTDSAELVVEIRSPGDESMAKIPWYLAQGCREVIIVDRDTLEVELHTSGGRRDPARSDVLGCTLETVDGPVLRVAWDGGAATIPRS
jgi:Uma2 family endonuclease